MKNTYCYYVVKNIPHNIPLHIVEATATEHNIKQFCVFSTNREAKEWCMHLKESYRLTYDPDFKENGKLITEFAHKTDLINDGRFCRQA